MPAGESKSQRKRNRQALHDLGRELVGLPDDHLVQLELPETVAEPIRAARTLERGALQRQLRYIGGTLEQVDADAVREKLRQLQTPHRTEVIRFHAAERWRDRLLDEGDSAITALLAELPHTDPQVLRQLVRSAAHEEKTGKPPKSARALFRLLRDLLDAGD